MSDPTELRDLVRAMVRLMVDRPQDVLLVFLPGTETVIQVQVHRGDLGKMIGKDGRTARSMRTVVLAMGMQANVSVPMSDG